MTHQEFFEYKLAQKFGYEAADRVYRFMRRYGYLEGSRISTTQAAAAVLFAGFFPTRSDMDTLGRPLLQSGLLKILNHIISDELNAVTIDRLTFNRMASKLEIEFVDGSYQAVDVKLPIRPEWKQPAGVRFNQSELVSLATDLAADEFIAMGRQVTEENDRGY